MADLFLSYSPKDAETAHKIAQELERRGSSIFYQRPEELDNNQLQTLDHEMSLASWVIVLWSSHALQDGRITYEAMHARDKNNLLSVQIEPNSIPAEYNNDQSPDHVNYQNQLTGIIQQTLSPAPSPSLAKQPDPQQGIGEEKTGQDQQDAKTEPGQVSGQVVPQPETPKEVASVPEITPPPTQSQPSGQTTAQQIQKVARGTGQDNTGHAPRQNLQQKLAEKTGAGQPAKENRSTENKVGQPPAPKTEPGLTAKPQEKRVLTPLPTQNTAKTVGAATSIPEQVAAPETVVAAANTPKSGKFIPIALMSVGTILLGSVGAGYWYLANNNPASAISPKATTLIKSNPAPVKVAINKVSPPKSEDNTAQQDNAPISTQKKGLVSTEDDPLLSSILNKFPSEKKEEPAPAPAPSGQKAIASGSKDMAENMVIQASAQRGEKSISQCSGCHSFTQNGPNKSGPNLYGVMNQLIGSERKFNYSDTLRSMGAIGEVWNKDQLDCYLKNPAVCMPGTKMGFNGVKSHRKRADIIAYLNSLRN